MNKYSLSERAYFQIKLDQEPIKCTIVGVHFYNGKKHTKVKYDIALWLDNGATTEMNLSTRLYNIDEIFIDGTGVL